MLIAQLSTAAGIRAPLAHVADQVFLDLAKELESQGLGRKVVADMFGMAVRGYQKKVQRLTESVTVRDRTLWEAVLDFVRDNGGATRRRVFERFRADDEEAVASVLRDLVSSGLVLTSGHGATSIYRATSEADLRRLVDAESADSLAALVWAIVYHHPGIYLEDLAGHLSADRDALRSAITALVAEGRLECDDAVAFRGLRATVLVVPVGAESGWEGAVYDHFHAVASAIAAKLRLGTLKADMADRVGGTTLHFEIRPGHPLEEEVYGLLRTVRANAHDLWRRVCEHNASQPIEEDEKVSVCFYFGQSVVSEESGR